MTTTVESIFGTGRMVDGFFLNNQLTDFSFSPVDAQGRPVANAVAPGKRPRSSMVPTILLTRDGRFAGAIGSAGGNAILAYVAKSLVAAIDWNMPMRRGAGGAEPRRARQQLQRRSDQILAQMLDGPAPRGIDLKPGQGEDSGVHRRADPRRQDRRRRRSAPRRRGADAAALGRLGPDSVGDVGKAVALEPRGKSVGDPPRDARAFDRPSRYRAGPGSRPRGCAPTRRRQWRSRRRRSAGFRRRWRARNPRNASSASAFSGAPDRPPCSPAKRDLSGGRDTVVLATMMASMPWSIAARTIWSGSPSPRSGATFRKIGGLSRRALLRPPPAARPSAPSSCSSRKARRVGRADVDRQVVARPAPSRARRRHNRRCGPRCPCWRRC